MWTGVAPSSPPSLKFQTTSGMSSILIAGCGRLGLPLAKRLVEDGHQVTGVRRTADSNLDTNIQWRFTDLVTDSALSCLDQPFELAVIILPPASRTEEGYAQTYETGLHNLLNRLSVLNPDIKLIFVSSTSVYGQSQGEWVDETSTTQPARYNGQYLLRAEAAVLSFAKNRSTIIRFSGIYGGSLYLIKQMVSKAEVQRTPSTFTNRIHEKDCVRVLQHLVSRRLSDIEQNSLYIGSDLDNASQWRIANWVSEKLETSKPKPWNTTIQVNQNKRCRSTLLQQTGFEFHYPSFKEGYSELLDNCDLSELVRESR